jgi:16S rRNA (cytidine1402-2'-O)-methyltransferase
LLQLVPTPIGNLEDITFRALEALKNADTIFAEDTRVTKRLLSLLKERFNILTDVKKFISLHSHNESEILSKIDKSIFEENVVYVSDAGMPSVSDPGAKLVKFCIENSIEYDVLPGASASTLAYVMSGFLEKEFLFYGFLKVKSKERIRELEEILSYRFNTVIYESPKRIVKLLDEILTIDSERELFIAKELTKLNQKSFKGSAKELKEIAQNLNTRGEWVVVVSGNIETEKIENISKSDILTLNIPKKEKAKLLSKVSSKSVKECYLELI